MIFWGYRKHQHFSTFFLSSSVFFCLMVSLVLWFFICSPIFYFLMFFIYNYSCNLSKNLLNIGDLYLSYRYTLSHFWGWLLRTTIQDWLLWKNQKNHLLDANLVIKQKHNNGNNEKIKNTLIDFTLDRRYKATLGKKNIKNKDKSTTNIR